MADDPQKVSSMTAICQELVSGGSMLSVLFPWLPTWSRLKKVNAVKNLFFLISTVVHERKMDRKRHGDMLQYLIDQGDLVSDIIVVSTPRLRPTHIF